MSFQLSGKTSQMRHNRTEGGWTWEEKRTPLSMCSLRTAERSERRRGRCIRFFTYATHLPGQAASTEQGGMPHACAYSGPRSMLRDVQERLLKGAGGQ